MAMTAEQKAAIAREARTFLESVDAALVQDLKEEAVLQMLELELETAEQAARIIVIDMARAMLRAVDQGIAKGAIPKEWDNPATPGSLITVGLRAYDPRVAFQASMRAAYSAGRYQRAMRSPMQYLVFRSMRDSRVRPTHKALNGVTLPKHDKFWDAHYPALGWRCRCKAFPIDEVGIQRLLDAGVQVLREAPDEPMVEYVNKATGEKRMVPASIEPGWDYNPAKEPQHLAEMVKNRMRLLQEEAATQ